MIYSIDIIWLKGKNNSCTFEPDNQEKNFTGYYKKKKFMSVSREQGLIHKRFSRVLLGSKYCIHDMVTDG